MTDPTPAQPSDTAAPVTAATAERRAARYATPALLVVAVIVLLAMALLFPFGGGGADAMDAVDTDRIQAVYLTNDRVFFGNLEASRGDWLLLRDAVFLRRSATPAAGGEEEGEQDQRAQSTDLVPFEQEVGGDGDMLINAREVVLVQNLDDSSEIARALDRR